MPTWTSVEPPTFSGSDHRLLSKRAWYAAPSAESTYANSASELPIPGATTGGEAMSGSAATSAAGADHSGSEAGA